jgi:hypothetical protein
MVEDRDVRRSIVALLLCGVLIATVACGREGTEPIERSQGGEDADPSTEAPESPTPRESPTLDETTEPRYELIAGGFRGSVVCGEYEINWLNPGLKAKLPADATLVVSGEDGGPVLSDDEPIEFGHYVALSPTWCGDVLGDGGTVFAHTTFSGGAHCCFTMYVTRLEDSQELLEAPLGNAAGLEPNQLDGGGALELVGLSDVFAYFDGLGFAGAPFLPLVYSFDGEHYIEATRRFVDHVGKDLDIALAELDSAVATTDTPRIKTFALWAYGDYILLGEPADGLSDVKARVPDGIDAWLERHAGRAVKLINERYSAPE